MFGEGMGFQNLGAMKANQQLEAAESRLNKITDKISKFSDKDQSSGVAKKENRDWTQAYATWEEWAEYEQLKADKTKEQQKIERLMNNIDANMGHAHDHSKERLFFEAPEEYKFAMCERNRLLGNYLFKEGILNKAAEHYQVAIAYYEYCFPDNNDAQAKLDLLRHACLCNVSLCHRRLGNNRQAVEDAAVVITESKGKHAKAYFRRAQAYKALDEYE